jgi:transposase-like protein
MFMPTLSQLELIAEMTWGGMPSGRIASALGIPPEVFSAWVSRLRAANELDPETVDRLLYPSRPVAVRPEPRPPTLACRVLAERLFPVAAE